MLFKVPEVLRGDKKPSKSDSSAAVGQLFMTEVKLNIPESKPVARKKLVDDSLSVANSMRSLFKEFEHRYRLVTTEEELVDYMSTRPELGLDTETDGLNRYTDKIVGFSLGNADDCIYVPLFHRIGTNYQGDLDRLGEILNADDRFYWGMNTKFDRGGLKYNCGFDVRMKWDAEIAARLLDNRDSAALKFQYVKYIDPKAAFYEFGQLFKQPFSFYDPAVVGIYGGIDAMKHYVLGAWQEKRMREHFPRIYKLMRNVELPLVDVVLDAELRGIAIDVEYYAQFTSELRGEMQKSLSLIHKDFPGLNPNSPKQVAEVLFDRLRLPDPSRSRKTGEEFLEKIHHPIARLILEVRKLTKAISTYTEGIPATAILDADGVPVVHTTYHTVGADTGRFSSTAPNLQNQPRDNRFRRGFVARAGHLLVSCDFSQQEQVILAALSQDPKMLEGAERGQDFYALMASIIWNLPYGECTKRGKHGNLRDKCKGIVLGVTYGMTSASLAVKLTEDSNDGHLYTKEECDEILSSFYRGFPLVKAFQERCMELGRTQGFVETVLGRRKYFEYLGKPKFECDSHPEVAQALNRFKYYNQIKACLDEAKQKKIKVIDNRWRQGDELRQTTNGCVQGSAADQTKVCMIALYRDKVFREEHKGQILLQVHDELIAEFPEELAEVGGNHMAKVMEEVGSALIGARIRCEPLVMKHWVKD